MSAAGKLRGQMRPSRSQIKLQQQFTNRFAFMWVLSSGATAAVAFPVFSSLGRRVGAEAEHWLAFPFGNVLAVGLFGLVFGGGAFGSIFLIQAILLNSGRNHAWDWFKAGMLGYALSLAYIEMAARAIYWATSFDDLLELTFQILLAVSGGLLLLWWINASLLRRLFRRNGWAAFLLILANGIAVGIVSIIISTTHGMQEPFSNLLHGSLFGLFSLILLTIADPKT